MILIVVMLAGVAGILGILTWTRRQEAQALRARARKPAAERRIPMSAWEYARLRQLNSRYEIPPLAWFLPLLVIFGLAYAFGESSAVGALVALCSLAAFVGFVARGRQDEPASGPGDTNPARLPLRRRLGHELRHGDLRSTRARVSWGLSVLLAVASPVILVVALSVGGRSSAILLIGLLIGWLLVTALMPWAIGGRR